MKKGLVLILISLILGAAKMNDVQTINVVDYAGYIGPNGGISFGDYYIGKIHLNNLSQELWFEPVVTKENVGSGKFKQIWHKISSEKQRLYIDDIAQTITKRLNEYKADGIYVENAEGKRIVVKIGSEEFLQTLKGRISTIWGIVNPKVGDKYFKNGWSEGRDKELSENREYYSFIYPFQKMSLQEYTKAFGYKK